jgi:hypothetical protein
MPWASSVFLRETMEERLFTLAPGATQGLDAARDPRAVRTGVASRKLPLYALVCFAQGLP